MNRLGDWNCRSCQHLNFSRRDSCHRCGEARSGDFGSFGGRGGSSFGFSGFDIRPEIGTALLGTAEPTTLQATQVA